jgi:DNA-binding GntR family transcriptional regulator
MKQKLDLRIAPRTVQQEVVEKLRYAILSGVFQPGHRLIESQLCESLGVSRPSLREALRSLQAERLIEIIPNRGPQVPVLSWRDAEEIYEVRELLEGEAAARCALTIHDEDIAALKGCIDAFRRAVHQNDPVEQVNIANGFFAIILRNCGNKIIEEVEASLLARVTFLRARSMSLPDRLKKSHDEIKVIYNAIRERDPQKARKAAQQHVANARDAAKRAFEKAAGQSERTAGVRTRR